MSPSEERSSSLKVLETEDPFGWQRCVALGVSFGKATSPPLRGSLSNDEKILKGTGGIDSVNFKGTLIE